MTSIVLSILDAYICWYVCICTYVLGVLLISMLTLNPKNNEEVRSMRPMLANKGSLFWSMMPSTSQLTSVTLKHVGSEDNESTSLPSPALYLLSLSAFSWSSYISFTSFSCPGYFKSSFCASFLFLYHHPSAPIFRCPHFVYDFLHCTFSVYSSPTDQVPHCTLVS